MFRNASSFAWKCLKPLMGLKIRAADAKEVGVGNPAEETCCHPNKLMLRFSNSLSTGYHPYAFYPRISWLYLNRFYRKFFVVVEIESSSLFRTLPPVAWQELSKIAQERPSAACNAN